jgi:hypothetical protein
VLPLDDEDKIELDNQLKKYYPERENPSAPLPEKKELFFSVGTYGDHAQQVAYESLLALKAGVMHTFSNHGYATGKYGNGQWRTMDRAAGKRLLHEVIKRGHLKCIHVIYENGQITVEEVDLVAEIGKGHW